MMARRTHQSFSSSSSSTPFTYDVYLSFRGVDTRKAFTDHLYSALVYNGIKTYRHDKEPLIGEAIGQELMKAIENSRISIPIFSKNYASSRWYLQELEKIMKCRETIGQTVFPVFLDGVCPSDVRNQKQGFKKAFRRHEQRLTVERWRKALREASNLAGLSSKDVADGDKSKLIELVVMEVLIKLRNTPLDVAQHQVGIDSRRKMTFTIVEIENKKTMQEVIEVVSDIDGVLSVMAVMTDKMNMELTVRGHVDIIPEMIMKELKEFLGTEVVLLDERCERPPRCRQLLWGCGTNPTSQHVHLGIRRLKNLKIES